MYYHHKMITPFFRDLFAVLSDVPKGELELDRRLCCPGIPIGSRLVGSVDSPSHRLMIARLLTLASLIGAESDSQFEGVVVDDQESKLHVVANALCISDDNNRKIETVETLITEIVRGLFPREADHFGFRYLMDGNGTIYAMIITRHSLD